MGSFTELVIAVRFREDTPPEILGAFKRWATDPGRLPDVDGLDLDLHGDRFPSELLADHPYHALLPGLFEGVGTVYFPGRPDVVLAWTGRDWTLTARVHHKTEPWWVAGLLRPLGRWIADGEEREDDEPPTFVGYLRFDEDDEPIHIGHHGDRLVIDADEPEWDDEPDDPAPLSHDDELLLAAAPVGAVPDGYRLGDGQDFARRPRFCPDAPMPPTPDHDLAVAWYGRITGGGMEWDVALHMQLLAYGDEATAGEGFSAYAAGISRCAPDDATFDLEVTTGADDELTVTTTRPMRGGVTATSVVLIARCGRFVTSTIVHEPYDVDTAHTVTHDAIERLRGR